MFCHQLRGCVPGGKVERDGSEHLDGEQGRAALGAMKAGGLSASEQGRCVSRTLPGWDVLQQGQPLR